MKPDQTRPDQTRPGVRFPYNDVTRWLTTTIVQCIVVQTNYQSQLFPEHSCISVLWTTLVSASDVTPTDRWLNVWCIRHNYLETLQECRSRPLIGWIIQDFRETERGRDTKPPHERRKPSCLHMWRRALIFSKVWEKCKVRGIESLKYIWEIYTLFTVIVGTFPCTEMWRWMKWTVIGCLTCRSNGLMGVSLKVWLHETRTTLVQQHRAIDC